MFHHHKTHLHFIFFCFLLLSSLFSACASGKKALKKGDYEKAVLLSIERLRKNNDHEKSLEILKQAYPLFIENQQDRLEILEKSPDINKWDEMVGIYQSVNNVANQIRICNPARTALPNPQRYDDELVHATKMASENHYQAGLRFWENPTRENARKAYYEFRKCENYTKNYRGEVASLLLEAKEKATIKIRVEMQTPPLPLTDERMVTEVLQELDKLNEKDFLRFYTPKVIARTGENPQYSDHVLQIAYNEFFVGDTQYQNRMERRVDSTGREVWANNQKTIVYDKFYADVNISSKQIYVRGTVNMQILEIQTRNTLHKNQFTNETPWRTEWATYQGDARALNDQYRKLIQVKEQQNPTRTQLFATFCENIAPRVRQDLRTFYQNL